jgi:hypothetical protein
VVHPRDKTPKSEWRKSAIRQPDECADKAAQELSLEFIMVFGANLRILAQWSRSPTREGVLAKPKPRGSRPS